jgi:hypothetical protein
MCEATYDLLHTSGLGHYGLNPCVYVCMSVHTHTHTHTHKHTHTHIVFVLAMLEQCPTHLFIFGTHSSAMDQQ